MSHLTQNPNKADSILTHNQISTGREQSTHEQVGTGDLWETGLQESVLWPVLLFHFRKNKRFLLNVFKEFFGNVRSIPTPNEDYEWKKMNKLRNGVLIDSVVSGLASPTVVIETANTVAQVLPSDVLQGNNGWSATVDSVAIVGGNEQITMTKHDGTNFTAADVQATQTLGFSHNVFAEGTGQPAGRKWRPDTEQNQLMIIKRSSSATGDAMSNRIEIDLPGGTKSYAGFNELLTTEEFIRDCENAYMFSYGSSAGNAPLRTEGFLRSVEAKSANPVLYTGAVTETAFQTLMMGFVGLNDNMDFSMLCGTGLLSEATLALRDYFIDGSVAQGSFAGKDKLAVGLGVSQYKFSSRTLSFVEYQGFDDGDVTGIPVGGASATQTDYSNFGLVLNMGTATGFDGPVSSAPYVSFRHKQLGNIDRSVVYGKIQGMTGSAMGAKGKDAAVLSNFVRTNLGTDVDADSFHMLSQVGAQLFDAENSHAYMRKIG